MRDVPQFGERVGGRVYADRPAAFGIAENGGKIALVAIEKAGGGSWRDLPGGAVDPGETPDLAVVREFGEETGLVITVVEALTEADQFFVNTDGTPLNNRATVFVVKVEGSDPTLKVEDDHTLIWIDPTEAIRTLRHPAHAWAVSAWLRRG
ncbi:NUDIX domain-containing protein [Phenylobacterium sp.]|uniref:NUDIX domain-containing protein n=1 Tax=Phenylobacterium sp. TaxID=1871053 RepID=UPI00286A2DF2|nr:NUDIX domain-containing protein [Phenylobacterium sp.]